MNHRRYPAPSARFRRRLIQSGSCSRLSIRVPGHRSPRICCYRFTIHFEARLLDTISMTQSWAAADSFRDLNALEQAAIIILRLLEIRPFEEGNVAAALGASSLATMRAGWPPIVISVAIRPRFNPAVKEGIKMNTRPMVDLLAESIYETLDSMIKVAKPSAAKSKRS